MAERSGGGSACKSPCRKCGQTAEVTADGSVCVKCESQQTGEGSNTHPAAGGSGQSQAEAGQGISDQVTTGNETLPEGGANAGQDNTAEGSGEAGEPITGSDVRDKTPSGEQDMNGDRGDVMYVQRVESGDKGEVYQKGMVNRTPKSIALALPIVMSCSFAAAPGEVPSSTCNPGQGETKQESIAASTDSKSSDDKRTGQVSVEKPNSNKTVSCRV